MFGAQYAGQEDFGGVVSALPPVTSTGGGGWSHRGAVVLPQKRKSGLPDLPKLPKPPYYR